MFDPPALSTRFPVQLCPIHLSHTSHSAGQSSRRSLIAVLIVRRLLAFAFSIGLFSCRVVFRSSFLNMKFLASDITDILEDPFACGSFGRIFKAKLNSTGMLVSNAINISTWRSHIYTQVAIKRPHNTFHLPIERMHKVHGHIILMRRSSTNSHFR
jgi:hypothetical protein